MENPARKWKPTPRSLPPVKRLRFGLLLAVILGSLLPAGCAPTYPKERLAESLVELCQREYKITVQAKFIEDTIGVLLVVPGLIDELRKQAAGAGPAAVPAVMVSGKYQTGGFDFTVLARGPFSRVDQSKRLESSSPKRDKESEAMKQLRHVSTALHRISLSTDAPLKFYKLIARDPGADSLDVIFYGHVNDSKRVQFHAISIGDLQFRSGIEVRAQPEAVGRLTIENFIQDLSTLPLPQVLAGYVSSTDRFGELFPKILSTAVEVKGKADRLLSADWYTLQTKRDEVLVYMPLYPIGDSGAILFTLKLADNRGSIHDIERMETSLLPSRYRKLGSVEDWKNQFFLEPVVITDFIANQITKRVISEFEPLEEIAEEEKPSRKKPAEPATPEEVTQLLVETAAYVVHSYEFTDFQEVTITNTLEGTRWVVPASDLELYRNRKGPKLVPTF